MVAPIPTTAYYSYYSYYSYCSYYSYYSYCYCGGALGGADTHGLRGARDEVLGLVTLLVGARVRARARARARARVRVRVGVVRVTAAPGSG